MNLDYFFTTMQYKNHNICTCRSIHEKIIKSIFKDLKIKKIQPLSIIDIRSKNIINCDILYEKKNIEYRHFDYKLPSIITNDYRDNIIILRIYNIKYGILTKYFIKFYYVIPKNIMYSKNNIIKIRSRHCYDNIDRYYHDGYDSDNSDYTNDDIIEDLNDDEIQDYLDNKKIYLEEKQNIKYNSFKLYFRYTLAFLNIL